jgi:hypothetical protein
MAVRGAAAYLALGHEVVIIDTVTARIADRIDAGGPVSCIAVSRDGTRLFVADYDGSLTALEVVKTGLELRAAS